MTTRRVSQIVQGQDCRASVTAGYVQDRPTLWYQIEHAVDPMNCKCRRNFDPTKETSNDNILCVCLFELLAQGTITIVDLPYIFSKIKLGEEPLDPNIADKLHWCTQRFVWHVFTPDQRRERAQAQQCAAQPAQGQQCAAQPAQGQQCAAQPAQGQQ
ncbi:hypothetical protein GGR51DRAFT_556526 [Nemania sp. FL0031]|nr:hypothetical protein GGR51DRAFT_556526 [Nemania sp. FL0031]